ncbi:MAG TPA: hypothetical protein VG389_26990 [Myxococcota bacterium]|nr:hypothetical protein [Myxococcota bacterium]
MTAHVLQRLARALGPDAGARCAAEALQYLRLDDLQTPNDLLRFADYLVAQGGITEAVGRALRITALLRGAGR